MFKILILPVITLILGLLVGTMNPPPEASYEIYPEELPGAYTGGFGEETCHSCHFDYPLNPEDEGSLTLEGIPEQYKASRQYIFTLTLQRKEMGDAGFQISSRFEDSSQAGSFDTGSEHLSQTKTDNSVQYLQHAINGSKMDENETSASWKISWTAPGTGSKKVIFNIAANAGNGDASAFGDLIFTRTLESYPSEQ